MPQQLIYTSAPRGIVAGRSGYCTVARSASLREALMLQLEKFSYYQHLSLLGGRERRISTCRTLAIRGTLYHVLSRIQDAGVDFTGRTNFLAQHLVFTPEEIRQLASPPVILAKWSGWLTAWTKDPENLANEDWGNLLELSTVVSLPAETWQILSGEAANGYGMLEVRAGASFRVDSVSEGQILALFAESLELLELRDPRRDHRVTAWQYTFTTSMQEQDNPADFKWRCLHADNPASSRFAGPDCRVLTEVKAIRVTAEEKSFAQLGRQPPRILAQPQDVRLTEGEAARLSVNAVGVPAPGYQWYIVDRSGAGQIIPGATRPELSLADPPFGVSRYVVRIANSLGDVTSEVAKVECERKLRLASAVPSADEVKPRAAALSYDPDYETKRDNQRLRYKQEELERENKNRRVWNKVTMISSSIVLVILVLAVVLIASGKKGSHSNSSPWPSTNATSQVGEAMQPKVISGNPKSDIAGSTTETNEVSAKVSPSKKNPYSLDDGLLSLGWSEKYFDKVSWARMDRLKEASLFEIETVSADFNEALESVSFFYKTNSENIFNVEIQMEMTNCVNGIMVRESLENNSKFLFIGVAPQKIYICQRDDKGLESTNFNDPNLKINSRINLAFSYDEKSGQWMPGCSTKIPITQFQISLSSNAMVGFAQAGGNTNVPAKARFKQLPRP